ncbi:pimeloyl-ACP methyl ester carboxylesterase [Rhizobium sp. BK181]|nr:pimeloyl-ACP methyl ester carboxylesterase [Rhizobium sp. BK181]
MKTPISKVAWKAKPSYFMVTTKDMMIPPTFQRGFAKRAGSVTTEIDSSHAVMLSHAKEVAAFIETADK